MPPTETPRRHVTRSRSNPGGAEIADGLPFRERKPPWLKVPAPGGPTYRGIKSMIREENLNTVCEEAACPNVGECWEQGTATFMILGDVCTRRCGFCNVQTGKPTWNDPLEPLRVATSVKRMGLRHAVVTSVDRDDLPDYGASAFVGVIRSIRKLAPGCRVEVLTPDFRGQEMPLAKVIAERPDVFNHNVETVPRLYPKARRGSDFARSCRVLRLAKEMGGDEVVTKSGLMVGLGEDFEEMVEAFEMLRESGVEVLDRRPVPATHRAAPADRPLLAPGRVRGAAPGRRRARLRVGGLGAAGAQLLPRRRERPRGGCAAHGRDAGDRIGWPAENALRGGRMTATDPSLRRRLLTGVAVISIAAAGAAWSGCGESDTEEQLDEASSEINEALEEVDKEFQEDQEQAQREAEGAIEDSGGSGGY